MPPLHQHLLNSDLLRDHITAVTYADGECVFPIDKSDGRANLALSGRAEITRQINGKSELIGELSSGQLFAELTATEDTTRTTTVRAKGELHTVAIDPNQLFRLTPDTEQAADLIDLIRAIYANHNTGQASDNDQWVDSHTIIATSFQDGDTHPVVVQYGKQSVTIQTHQKHWKATPQQLNHTEQEHNTERRLQVIDRRIVSAHLTGPCDETPQIIGAIRTQKPLSYAQRVSFESSGLLFGRAMNSDYLCICMRLTHAQLKSEFENGHDSVDTLRQQTGASTICGTCLECVQDLVDELTHEANTSDTSDTTLAHGQADAKGQLAPDFLSLGVGIAACVITLIGLSIPLGSEAFHQWQASSAGRWWSGGAFLIFLGYQWWMPIYRWSGGLAKADSLRHIHRRIGACMPLLLLFHNTSYGAGMLSLLTVAVLLHTIIGVADSSLISGQQRQQNYLRVWLLPHILIAFLITGLALYHVWVILTHGGP